MTTALETAFVGLITALAGGVTATFANRKWGEWRYTRNGSDRRRGNGSVVCPIASGGKMSDSAVPDVARTFYSEGREFQRENLKSLERIANTLDRIDTRNERMSEALIRLLERTHQEPRP